ncbi:MAG TPA: porin, partial [Edaphobacter sp.]|nr:porin [Edaphobacter sp.]
MTLLCARRLIFCLPLLLPIPAHPMLAQDSPALFPHPDGSRWLISGQANIVFQGHGPFHSPYEGANSLLSRGEYKTSLLGTLFLAAQIRKAPRSNTEILLDVESSGGRGVSQALGLAGFTNLDVV